MIVNDTDHGICQRCGEKIVLLEYVGLEGAWHTYHHCPKPRMLTQQHEGAREQV